MAKRANPLAGRVNCLARREPLEDTILENISCDSMRRTESGTIGALWEQSDPIGNGLQTNKGNQREFPIPTCVFFERGKGTDQTCVISTTGDGSTIIIRPKKLSRECPKHPNDAYISTVTSTSRTPSHASATTRLCDPIAPHRSPRAL